MRVVRCPEVPHDEVHVYDCMPDTAFIGIAAWKRLTWEDDPDEWYAAEVERMKERAPA